MGYIERLPSGRHRGVIRLADGRRRSAAFDYAYEAENWILEAEGRLANGQAPATPAPRAPRRTRTVGEHATSWLDRRRGTITKGTYDFYSAAVRALHATGIGNAGLDVLRRSDVEQWITDMSDDEVGVPTIRARIKTLRMVCRDALAEGHADRDPTDGIRLPTATIRADRNLTAEEEPRLIAAAGDELAAMVLLGVDAGLRWQEAAGVPVDALDLAAGYLTVRQVVERSGQVRGYPKGHRARVVPLTERTVAALAPLARRALLHRGPSGLLFVNTTGRALDYWDWRRDQWRPAVRAARLNPRPRFHDLRHTYGSRLAAAGVPRVEIAALMGHADEKTTARYVHAGDDGRRAALVRAALSA